MAVGVLCVIYTQRSMPASAGEAPAQSGPQSPTNEAQAALASPTPEQWRRHPSYQVLDHRAALPSMKVAAKGTLEIGGQTKLELEGASQMPVDQKKALAAQFELPVAALDRFLQRLAAQQGMGAEQGARQLRTLVIDYRFLRDRWTQYRPPSGQEKTKTEALQCLEAGDLDKAWAMFIALPAPAAPSQLQATKAP
jgi:hypothetical protein